MPGMVHVNQQGRETSNTMFIDVSLLQSCVIVLDAGPPLNLFCDKSGTNGHMRTISIGSYNHIQQLVNTQTLIQRAWLKSGLT